MKAATLDKKLGDVVSVQSGFAFKSSEYSDSGHFLIRIANVQDGYLSLEKPKYVTLDAKTKRFELHAGDILTSLTGNVGRVAKVEPEHLPAALNQRVARLVPKPDAGVDVQYLLRFLHSSTFSCFLEERAHGAAQANVSPSVISDVPIPLPPLEEQHRIVAVLDEAFEGLARARAHAEANLQNARELFESHLVDLFTHSDPAWERTQLSDYCEKITVGHVGPMANRYVSTGTPFLRSQNVRPFKIDLTDVKYIDEVFTKELGKSELRPGDVAIVRTGYPGTCAVIPDDLELANCADLVIARTGPKLNPHFLALLLNSTYGKELVAGASVGAAQKHFNVGAAKKAMFPFPPLSDQERLVAQADEISASCNRLASIAEHKLQDLDDLRQSLLQKAFAGELT